MKPYIDEKINNSSFLRTFRHNIPNKELIWHRDKKNRIVTILEGDDWEIQFDNQLPKKLFKNDKFLIPANIFHRIKLGKTDLKIKIEEFED